MSFSSLEGQTAIVTGGNRGLGKAIAQSLAQNKVNIHVISRNQESAQKAADELANQYGIKAWGWGANVGKSDDVSETLSQILKETPQIEVLVNNAGITKDGLLMRMKEDDFDSVIETNLKSVFLFSKAILRNMMKQRYGRIINISSIVGVRGQAGQANYAASKAGMIGFTKSFAKEMANRSITCNAIAPGFIESDMTNELTDEQKAGILTQIPCGRMGKPEEIGSLVTFLASKESGYITGQVLNIDGGMGI